MPGNLLAQSLDLVVSPRQSQSKEIAALRTQTIGLETDNERLKRQLTSERFER